jgi:phosphate transport system substrate-binding protein
MSQKNETPALIGSLLITAGLLGGGYWWFTQQRGANPPSDPQTVQSNSPQASGTPQASGASTPSQPGVGTFSQVQNVPQGLFRYGGSSSWAPIRLAIDSAMQAARPEYRLQYTDPAGMAPGSGTGIQMVIDGKIAFAQSSRPLTDEEYQSARQKSVELKQIPVAIDGLAVAVNPSLGISGLTIDQLKGIYTGDIKNWQQVGGPDLPIVPISRDLKSGGTVELFYEQVLNKQPFASSVQIVGTTTQALQKLGATPGGIYFASAPEVVPQCSIKPLPIGRDANPPVPPYQGALSTQCPSQRNQLNVQAFQNGTYPLTRDLFVIVKQDGTSAQKAGEAYANLLLSNQGQTAIANSGFVRVR